MARGLSKFYNLRTKLLYKMFHFPIRMKVAKRRRVKHPRLTVVMLHGISATSDTWDTTLRQLAKNPDMNDIEFIALDLLGFGKSLQSDWLDYDYTDYNEALATTLRHLKIQTPIVLIGHSMGSLISANFANSGKSPVEIIGLILVSPPILLPEEIAKLPDKVYTKSYSSLYRLAKDQPAIGAIANFIQRFSNFDSKYLKTPAFARSMDNVILNQQNYQTFKKLKIPTLIIHGHFDPLVMYSNLKRVADQNPTYVHLTSVIGHHDISAQKRMKILIELKRLLHEGEVK